MTTAHETIRQSLELAKNQLIAEQVYANNYTERTFYREKEEILQKALTLLETHAVVPRESTPEMLNPNLWIMHDEASAERTGNLKVLGNPIERTEQYHVRIKEEDQAEMYKAMIKQATQEANNEL